MREYINELDTQYLLHMHILFSFFKNFQENNYGSGISSLTKMSVKKGKW